MSRKNLSMSLRHGGFTPSTRHGVGLLGPCFKTGGDRRDGRGGPRRGAGGGGSTSHRPRAATRSPRARSGTVPRQRFHILCTLSPESFSTFPHGTCPLSDSCTYSALDGIHHPLWVAIPSNPTPWQAARQCATAGGNGALTLSGDAFQRHSPPAGARRAAQTTTREARFQAWAPPFSLAATRGIPVGFSSSAY